MTMFIRSHKTKTLPFCLPKTSEAVDHLARLGVEERRAIFTRREIVEFILDLAEYTVDRTLHRLRLLEPAFGDGDFLLVAVERLYEVSGIAKGQEPWILQSFDQLAIARRLEAGFPALEDAGRLVDLASYPRLAKYFKQHAKAILKRNCAENNPAGWYRTIDRIYRELTHQPKLLIPDIKGDAHIVYEEDMALSMQPIAATWKLATRQLLNYTSSRRRSAVPWEGARNRSVRWQ